MTYSKDIYLYCDGDSDDCEVNYGVQIRFTTATKARKNAKQDGWVYLNGEDYCPECK